MQKTLTLAATVLLVTTTMWAREALPSVDELAGFVELSAVELGEIEGEALYLGVDRNGKSMTVTSVVPGDYSNIECYTVNVTTDVVRNSDTGLAKNAQVNTNKKIVSSNNEIYHPTQIDSGTYNLTGTKSDVAGFGPGIKIDYTQKTTGLSGNPALSSDFYVHAVPYDNTNGCVGVKNKSMDRVMNTYKNSTGPKTISISGFFSTLFGLKR